MKCSLKQIGIVFAVLLSIGACGVHVGNALKKYQSPHGFEIEYNSSLNMTENADKSTVTFDNSASVSGNPNETSRAEFKVDLNETVGGESELLGIAQRTLGNRTFEKVTLNGSPGVASISREGDSFLTAEYFLITTKGNLLRASIAAFKKASGIDMVGGIVNTFRGGSGTGWYSVPMRPERHRYDEDNH